MQNLPAECTQKIPLLFQWSLKNSEKKINLRPQKQNTIFLSKTKKKNPSFPVGTGRTVFLVFPIPFSTNF